MAERQNLADFAGILMIQKIGKCCYQDAMGVVMLVLLGLMAVGAVLVFTLKQKPAKPEMTPKN